MNKIKILSVIIFAVICMISLSSISEVRQDVPDGWLSLFDGETLAGWKVLRNVSDNEPYVKDGVIVLPTAINGVMTGISWDGDTLPTVDYVIHYEARRIEGIDIFAALTFPYEDTYASLIFGGWNGVINGLSSIDGYDASGNETSQVFGLRNNQWYPVQLRVTTDSIYATVGHEEIVNISTAGKEIHLRDESLNTGLTFWTFRSTGEIRNIRIRKLK